MGKRRVMEADIGALIQEGWDSYLGLALQV